ncbi:MAG TPA: DUF302 domain-containing protein [Thermomicrobiales bacterium]|nr:DUF302 domain-containing protein [Thermomicrobiales bacterium]
MSAIESKRYAIGTEVQLSFDEAVEKVTAALKEEGFGVLTTIDVQKTLKEKLDVDRPRYLILGACNPGYANQALQAEPQIGVLLPCNVVVYEEGDKTRVVAMDPQAALQLADNPEIEPVAREVRARIERVIASLG